MRHKLSADGVAVIHAEVASQKYVAAFLLCAIIFVWPQIRLLSSCELIMQVWAPFLALDTLFGLHLFVFVCLHLSVQHYIHPDYETLDWSLLDSDTVALILFLFELNSCPTGREVQGLYSIQSFFFFLSSEACR